MVVDTAGGGGAGIVGCGGRCGDGEDLAVSWSIVPVNKLFVTSCTIFGMHDE